MLRLTAVGLVLAALLFSGCAANTSCTNGAGGQTCESPGTLSFNGSSNGSHSTTASCGTNAEVHVSANMGSGSLKVTVKDGAGVVEYTKTMSSAGQAMENRDLTGTKGTWTITAERSGGLVSKFSGQYNVHLEC